MTLLTFRTSISNVDGAVANPSRLPLSSGAAPFSTYLRSSTRKSEHGMHVNPRIPLRIDMYLYFDENPRNLPHPHPPQKQYFHFSFPFSLQLDLQFSAFLQDLSEDIMISQSRRFLYPSGSSSSHMVMHRELERRPAAITKGVKKGFTWTSFPVSTAVGHGGCGFSFSPRSGRVSRISKGNTLTTWIEFMRLRFLFGIL